MRACAFLGAPAGAHGLPPPIFLLHGSQITALAAGAAPSGLRLARRRWCAVFLLSFFSSFRFADARVREPRRRSASCCAYRQSLGSARAALLRVPLDKSERIGKSQATLRYFSCFFLFSSLAHASSNRLEITAPRPRSVVALPQQGPDPSTPSAHALPNTPATPSLPTLLASPLPPDSCRPFRFHAKWLQ